jgi:hypothetical protein
MEAFRTTFDIPKGDRPIDYTRKILLLGSCFAENMGDKLVQNKFQTLINPFGILHNPYSIANSIGVLISGNKYKESDLFEFNGVWNSFSHHSRFSGVDREVCLKNINTGIEQGTAFLKQADYLIITFGTAWVYQLKKSGEVVANCHKLPTGEFNRNRISESYIVEKCLSVFKILSDQNRDLKIILTVSPVRHLKDGLVENQLSKATLLMAVHKLVSEFEAVSYFPSYELMMDDLRDYRFYADDMVHPSPLAIEYIWENFKNSWINPNVYGIMKEVTKIRQAMDHKPFFMESESHQSFIKNQLMNIGQLGEKHPEIDLSIEKEYFERQLLV